MTFNQQKVFEKVSEKVLKGEKVSISGAMRGIYAPSVAKKPNKLTNSLGWQKLLNKHLPDSLLSKVHKEGLSATTFFTEGLGKGETVLVEKPDYAVRHKYLESGYKIKGKLKEIEAPQTNTTNNMMQIIIHGADETDPRHISYKETGNSMEGIAES